MTGATGFVGSRLTEVLRKNGATVVALSRSGGSGSTAVDLADPASVAALDLDGVTAVVHVAAALPSAEPEEIWATNVAGTAHLLARLGDAPSLEAITLISSVAVYDPGKASAANPVEPREMIPPMNVYGRSKLLQEMLVFSFAHGRSILPTVFRVASLYGRTMKATSVLPQFVDAAKQGEPLIIHGPASYRQNFLHVDDLAKAATRATLEHRGGIWNLFSRDSLSLSELAEMVCRALESPSVIDDNSSAEEYEAPNFDGSKAAEALQINYRSLGEEIATW